MLWDQAVFTLGHSPDPDDAFMFYAMAKNKIDLRGYRFEHRLEDIQTLNERALRGELHISAISIHAYAHGSFISAISSTSSSRLIKSSTPSKTTRPVPVSSFTKGNSLTRASVLRRLSILANGGKAKPDCRCRSVEMCCAKISRILYGTT